MVPRLLDLPGLQIFLPRGEKSGSQDMQTPTMQDSLKSYSFNPPWKNISSSYCDTPGMNEYSPTVVDEELFGTQSSHLDNNNILFSDNVNINQQVYHIKKDLGRNRYTQFNDEFRYSIVSSHVLNDYTPYIEKLHIKRSILDLHQSSNANDKWVLDHLVGENWKTISNIKFNRLILRCCQLMASVRNCKFTDKNQHKYTLFLLKAFYLIQKTKQQVHDTARYKMMLSLKEFLKRLEDCDMIIHKLLLNYKTLRNSYIFEESSSLKAHAHNNETSHLVKNLLKSNLDSVFFSLRYRLEMVLPLTDKECLSKYTGIYGIKATDLRYFLNSEVKHLNDKADRVNITQKFLLCCLLSISFQNEGNQKYKTVSQEFDNILTLKFVPKPRSEKVNNDVLGNCEVITDALSNLSIFMESTTELLFNYKDFLNQSTIRDDISAINSQDGIVTTRYQVVRLLNEVEAKLKLITNIREKNLIQGKLHRMLHVTNFDDVDESGNDSHTPDHKYHILNQPDKSITSTSTHRSNRGFSLDIVRHTYDLSSSVQVSPQKINLNEKVEFMKIDNSTALSDSEDVYEEMFVNHHNYTIYNGDDDDTCIPPSITPQLAAPNVYGNITSTTSQQIPLHDRRSYHYESLHKLSDEELSMKLNQKIINFASKNKAGKNQLRAQKSFELLKRQDKHPYLHRAYHSSHCHNPKQNRNISGPLSTEDTIPIIYEMRELMNN